MKNLNTIVFGLVICGTSVFYSMGINANNFNGPYLSAGIGGNEHIFQDASTVSISLPVIPLNISFNPNGSGWDKDFKGSLYVGYDNTFNHQIYTALEAGVGLQKKLGNQKTLDTTSILGGVPVTHIHLNTKANSSNSNLSFLFKAGFLTTPKTVIYGLIGTEVSRFNVYERLVFSADFGSGPVMGWAYGNKSSTKAGFTLGLGMDSYLTDNLTYGIKFIHTIYKNVPSPMVSGILGGAATGPIVVHNMLDIHAHALTLNATYHF